MFTETKQGQTHSYNDGCGDKKHNCNECQFENGEHSLECGRYKEKKLPTPKKQKEKVVKELPKTLENNESTFRNGGGAMCGGVVSKSRFYADPWGLMMAYYMEDDKFEVYKKIEDEKKRHKYFEKYARSAI